MPRCNESCTGEHIFNLMNRELVKYDISWTNCLSFGCDNASVMTGKYKGVAKFVEWISLYQWLPMSSSTHCRT